jgi:hypothetical protein
MLCKPNNLRNLIDKLQIQLREKRETSPTVSKRNDANHYFTFENNFSSYLKGMKLCNAVN